MVRWISRRKPKIRISKLSIQEIQQIWKAVKDITRSRAKASQSTLEIARKAGWDDSIMDIGTRVTTAISHRDVQLDFFLYYPHLIKELNSGEFLSFDGNGCHNSKGQAVVRFSKQFLTQIATLRHKNYVPKTAKIRFIV